MAGILKAPEEQRCCVWRLILTAYTSGYAVNKIEFVSTVVIKVTNPLYMSSIPTREGFLSAQSLLLSEASKAKPFQQCGTEPFRGERPPASPTEGSVLPHIPSPVLPPGGNTARPGAPAPATHPCSPATYHSCFHNSGSLENSSSVSWETKKKGESVRWQEARPKLLHSCCCCRGLLPNGLHARLWSQGSSVWLQSPPYLLLVSRGEFVCL